jgi:hypothetical protein
MAHRASRVDSFADSASWFGLLQHAEATTDAWSELFARCAMKIGDDEVKG